MDENGPWVTLVEDQLSDTSNGQPASLLSFTLEEVVEIQFIKFDLISYWGTDGGGLQYFAAIPATSKASTMTTIMNLESILLFLQLSATSQSGQNGLAAANLIK